MLFVDGDGASRASLRNLKLAVPLNEAGFATLLVDLLTEAERTHRHSRERELSLITCRIKEVTRWVNAEPETTALPIGCLGASTGAAAALRAAAAPGDSVHSVVSLGGGPDIVSGDFAQVTALVLLLAGSRDPDGLGWAREAAKLLHAPHQSTM